MGSKAAPPSIGSADGKIKLTYPSVQPLPPGYVNTFDFESFRTLALIRGFVSSASESVRSGRVLPGPTNAALLNETILELNLAMSEGLRWHNEAVVAQSSAVTLPDGKVFERAVQQVKATFSIYLAYARKELVGEVMRSSAQT